MGERERERGEDESMREIQTERERCVCVCGGGGVLQNQSKVKNGVQIHSQKNKKWLIGRRIDKYEDIRQTE